MPVRSILTFNVQDGAEAMFKTNYLEKGFLHRAQFAPGFLHGEFLHSDTQPRSFIATALWRSKADYMAWTAAYLDMFAEEDIQALRACLKTDPKSQIYDVLTHIAAKNSTEKAPLK